jgi:hypothetical protein
MDIVVTVSLLAIILCDLLILLDICKCLPEESNCWLRESPCSERGALRRGRPRVDRRALERM